MKEDFDKAAPVMFTALHGHPVPILRADIKSLRAASTQNEQGKTVIFFQETSRQPLYVGEEINEVLRILNGMPNEEQTKAYHEQVGAIMGIPAQSVMASEIGRKHMDELVLQHCKDQGAGDYYFNSAGDGVYKNVKAKPSGDDGESDLALELRPNRDRYEEIASRNRDRLSRASNGRSRGRGRDDGGFSL